MKFHIITFTALLSACGGNIFTAAEKKDPVEDATILLEKQKPDEAIELLEPVVAKDPTNYRAASILALAYGQKYEVDPITFIQRMGTESSSSDSSDMTGLTGLFDIMPAATSEAIDGVDRACELLLSIPSEQLNAADAFKLAMFQTAALTLKAKSLDTNGDGELSPEEILLMSGNTAASIISQLAGAATAFAGGEGGSVDASAASGKVEDIQAAIASQPGDTDEERLRNYLNQSNTGGTSGS